jgi:hypothetical protein
VKKRLQIGIYILTVVLLYSCSNYENKSVYELSVGETVKIYTSTNSCCHYCFLNKDALNHSAFIETVREEDSDCAGCHYTNAYLLQGKSVGIDTVRLQLAVGSDDCDSASNDVEQYVIKVK